MTMISITCRMRSAAPGNGSRQSSGSSGIGEEAPQRAAEISKAEVKGAERFPASASAEELKAWAEKFL